MPMLSPEILKKIAEIEIHTRRIMSSTLIGDSRSAQKGSGFEFNQIRDYQMGDDVRFIDWRACARSGKLLIKEYIEERSRTIMILLDVSASTVFTSTAQTKLDVMRQVAAVLTFVAGFSKDRVGLIAYSDRIEAVIPPATGPVHVHSVIKKIFSCSALGSSTNSKVAFDRLMLMKNRKAALFIVSDCIDQNLNVILPKIGRIFETVVIRCLDGAEKSMPKVGFLPIQDPETGMSYVLDTRKFSLRYGQNFLENRTREQRAFLVKYGVDCLDIVNSNTFIRDVIQFFRRRMSY